MSKNLFSLFTYYITIAGKRCQDKNAIILPRQAFFERRFLSHPFLLVEKRDILKTASNFFSSLLVIFFLS